MCDDLRCAERAVAGWRDVVACFEEEEEEEAMHADES